MKAKSHISAIFFSLAATAAASVTSVDNLVVQDIVMNAEGSRFSVGMTLVADGVKMKSNREVRFTPMLVNGADTVRLPYFTIAGRGRFYRHIRNSAEPGRAYRAGQITAPIAYNADTDYLQWMDGATLVLAAIETGCCSEPVSRDDLPLARLIPPMEEEHKFTDFAMEAPKQETVKTRSIEAKAYIDFPVNKTAIYPSYRRNPVELEKIIGTIDSVKNDPDITITSIHIKGFASPEGSYANNERLAKGRTATLADYVRTLYRFPKGMISTSYEPEDWAGLREYVESASGRASLSNASGILEIINSAAFDGNDDARDAAIRKKYPADYRFLLENEYPALRHSDYSINYNVRSYTSTDEIREVMRTAPQKLSAEELYRFAMSEPVGSDSAYDAIVMAAVMYPSDTTANLNAAYASLEREDLVGAARYIERAGNSGRARLARALLTGMKGDPEKALEMIDSLGNVAGVSEARAKFEAMINPPGPSMLLLRENPRREK